jgi:hypothetical protein
MKTITVPFIHNGVTGQLEPTKVLRDDVQNAAAFDGEPLVMPRCDFSDRVNNSATCGCQKKATPVTNSSGFDGEPLVAPKLDFSHRR